MNGGNMSKGNDELHRIAEMADSDIDTSDIPEIRDWSRAEPGKFYRPGVHHQVPVYLDTETQEYLSERAAAKGVSLDDLANELLKRDIEVVKAVES